MKCPTCPRRKGRCHGERSPRLCELARRECDAGQQYREYLARARPPWQLPPLWAQAANFARALARMARHRFRLAVSAERRRRLAACLGCDRYRPEDGRCGACGCVAAIKSAIDAERCPLSKW